MWVHLLGTGGALTSVARGNTSFAVVEGGTPLLVECSGDPVRAFRCHGLDWRALCHVVLSHRHTDHLSGLPSLVQQLSIDSRCGGRSPLTLWGPEDALTVAERLLDAVSLLHGEGRFEIRLRTLPLARHDEPLGDVKMTSFPVDHGATPTLGVRLTPTGAPRSAVVYSSDTSPCDLVLEHGRDAALLLHECTYVDGEVKPGHTTLARLEEMLGRITARQVALVHLPPMAADEEAQVARQLKARYGERVVLGRDGQVFEV